MFRKPLYLKYKDLKIFFGNFQVFLFVTVWNGIHLILLIIWKQSELCINYKKQHTKALLGVFDTFYFTKVKVIYLTMIKRIYKFSWFIVAEISLINMYFKLKIYLRQPLDKCYLSNQQKYLQSLRKVLLWCYFVVKLLVRQCFGPDIDIISIITSLRYIIHWWWV